MEARLGIIGGSGLYDFEALKNPVEVSVATPFGAPSDVLVQGHLHGRPVVFLPRHGRGHRLLPGELNHRANIYALKQAGVTQIISLSAVGSLKEGYAPGDVVLVDQFVDRTKASASHTFFGGGIVAHVAFAHPTCTALGDHLHTVLTKLLAVDNPRGIRVHRSGTYVNMEGPAFSTLAESHLYRSWGLDVIGMTNLAEAKLAREAEICYQTVALVTDYDCWHQTHDTVTVELIIRTLQENTALARHLVAETARGLPAMADCPCRSALKFAIVTNPAMVSPELRRNLAPIIGKYLPAT